MAVDLSSEAVAHYGGSARSYAGQTVTLSSHGQCVALAGCQTLGRHHVAERPDCIGQEKANPSTHGSHAEQVVDLAASDA